MWCVVVWEIHPTFFVAAVVLLDLPSGKLILIRTFDDQQTSLRSGDHKNSLKSSI